jgi:DivIVA domain-containing protein
MGAVEMDRQAIERRDFPIVRRGYDPASVDAHLRSLASEIEELRQQAGGAGRDSIASAAGAQVQGILEAAQASAQAIEAEAAEQAQRDRDQAAADARRTREQAVATAQERVAAVAAATEALLQRVGTMDGETSTLIESLRGGAGRLVADLQTLKAEMGALYDAAAARASAPDAVGVEPAQAEPSASQNGAGAVAVTPVPAPAPKVESKSDAPGGHDVDGARLVALNMALNGDSREETGRYLAENFQVPDTEKLLDEVYAAIEG